MLAVDSVPILTLRMLGNILLILSSADFFLKINCSKKTFKNTT